MSDKIPHYDGLYEELNASSSPDYIFSELIATRSQAFGWVIRPHIHTQLFQLFVVESGELLFTGSSLQKTLNGPCLLLIPPATLHGLTYSPDVKGKIITISMVILEDLFKTSSATILTLTNPQLIQYFDEEYSFLKVQMLIKQLDEELFGDLEDRRLMLQTYITQLFITLQRMLQFNEELLNDASPSIQYFRQFQKLLKVSEYPKSIPQFAEELKISTVHLNRVCQNVVGKSALQLVQEYLIEESKKYLSYTSHSVSEIAYLMKFEYPNYFAKLFRKQTGVSPSEFRENVRKGL